MARFPSTSCTFRSRAALALAVGVLLSGCAAATADAVDVRVGALEVTNLRLTAQADDAPLLTATVANDSGVDRAFTIRWPSDDPVFERSALVPARTTVQIGIDDGFVITRASAETGDQIVLTVAQGFFSSSRDAAVEVTITVTAPAT